MKNKAIQEEKMVIVCAGDSLTKGTISGNYLGQLEQRFPQFRFHNAGVNGDTSAGLLRRVDRLLSLMPQIVTLLIGTNDVRKADDLAAYRINLEAILRKLEGRRVAILSIPPLGEQRFSEINMRVEKWNRAIREVATEHSASYLPLFETIAAQLTNTGEPFKLRIDLMIAASFRRRFLGQSFDEIAAAHGFTILTDQIHLSDKGANIVANLIGTRLTEGSTFNE